MPGIVLFPGISFSGIYSQKYSPLENEWCEVYNNEELNLTKEDIYHVR